MDHQFRMKLNVDGIEYPCDVGFNVIDKGTIFARAEDDWFTDPPERPAIKFSYIEDFDIEEIPSFEVTFLSVYGPEEEGDANTPEEVDAYFVMHPGTKEQVMNAVETYCKTDLVRDIKKNGFESTDAYDVHITD